MVKIILKGMQKNSERHGNYSFEIARFNAGVVLLEKGGAQITITDKKLSSELLKFFEN